MMYGKDTANSQASRESWTRYSHASPGPPSDSGSEDSWKDKYENLTILVQQQQKELQKLKLRDQGVATMNSCLQEEKTENMRLRTDNANLKREVTVLQNRLSNAGLSSQTSLQESESLLPGQSKHVFDNLVRENARLKQIIKGSKLDPAFLEESQQSIARLQQMVLDLTNRNNKLQAECDKLRHHSESGSGSFEFEKLQSLVKSLEQTQNAPDTATSIEETGFKSQLQEMARMCQALLKKMEAKESSEEAPVNLGVQRPNLQRSDSGIGEEQTSRLKEEIIKLKDENRRLNQDCREMLETNQRWTAYNSQREEYIRQLLAEVAMQRARLEEITMTPSMSVEQQQEFDRLIAVAKKKAQDAEGEKVKVEDENRELRQQLQKAHEDLQARLARTSGRMDAQEHIQVLEAQVQLCTEDFESERRDRERAQARITELETDLDLAKRQLEQFQNSHMTHLYNQRMAALSNYRNEYEARHGNQDRQLIARGMVPYEADGPNEEDSEGEGEDTVDFTPRPPAGPPAAPVAGAASRSGGNNLPQPDQSPSEDMLQCPRCKTDFPTSKHDAFLQHIEICCD